MTDKALPLNETATDPILARIQNAISAGDWPEALRLAADGTPVPGRNIFRAAAVEDWATVMRLEPFVLRSHKLKSAEELPRRLAEPLIVARLKLQMRPEALDLARAISARFPASKTARHKIVAALRSLGQTEQALKAALDLWADGFVPSINSITACMIRLKAFDECMLFLQTATRQVPASQQVRLLINKKVLAIAVEDFDAALKSIQQLKGLVPEAQYTTMLAEFARQTRREDLLEEPFNVVLGWSTDPGALGTFLENAPAILRDLWGCRPDNASTLALMQQITSHLLSPNAALIAAGVCSRLGRDDMALSTLQRGVAAFPSALPQWSKLLTLYGQMRDETSCAMVVKEMNHVLPRSAVLSAILDAIPSTWVATDLPDLAQFAEDNQDPTVRAKFIAGLSMLPTLPEEMEQILEARVAQESPLNGLGLSFVLRRTRDRRMLQSAVAAPVSFSAFQSNREASARHFEQGMNAIVAPGAIGSDPLSQAWFERCWRLIDQLSDDAAMSTLYTAESFADTVALTDFLVDRILRKVPTSAIRLGDCEGSFLPVEGDWDADTLFHQQVCKKIWWGDRRPESAAERAMITDFIGSIDRADVLGVLPPWRLVTYMSKRQSKHIYGAVEHGLTRMVERGAPPVITSAHFHQDLDAWSLWDEIFAATPSISWISCHDLAPYLRDVRGVNTRQGISIPPEQKWSGLFRMRTPGDCLPCPDDDRQLIDLHDDLCASLAPEPGEVWLVAAGFLGKIYCDLICQRGGIALDIGSIADYWMGFSTRQYHGAESKTVIPALLPILGRNRPLPDQQTLRNRLIGLPGVARSAHNGGWNIADAAEANPPPPSEHRTLRVIGHPRCASGYISTVFTAHNLLVGHEKLARDGISSWMYVVRDHRLPYGDNATLTHQFRYTVLHLRDPADAIASIVLENGLAPSFDFRRGHILRATGQDIADFAQPLIRAVASYVLWNQMALALNPDAVFAVERAEEEVPAWLSRMGIGQPGPVGAQGISGFNASERKRGFVLSKPVLSEQHWGELASKLPDTLQDGLAAICALGGYSVPWMQSSQFEPTV